VKFKCNQGGQKHAFPEIHPFKNKQSSAPNNAYQSPSNNARIYQQ